MDVDVDTVALDDVEFVMVGDGEGNTLWVIEGEILSELVSVPVNELL